MGWRSSATLVCCGLVAGLRLWVNYARTGWRWRRDRGWVLTLAIAALLTKIGTRLGFQRHKAPLALGAAAWLALKVAWPPQYPETGAESKPATTGRSAPQPWEPPPEEEQEEEEEQEQDEPGEAEIFRFVNRYLALRMCGQLDQQDVRQLMGSAELLSLPAGQPLYRSGQSVPGLCIVRSGAVALRRPGGETVALARRGDCIGELALLLDEPAGLDCEVELPARVVLIRRGALERLADSRAVRNYLAGSIGRLARVSCTVLGQLLGCQPPADCVPVSLPTQLLQGLPVRSLAADQLLVDSDCVAGSCFLLTHGQLALSGRDGRSWTVAAEEGSGHLLGLRAFISCASWDLVVRAAAGPASVLILEWPSFERLLASCTSQLLVAVDQVAGPPIRQFSRLGFRRSYWAPGCKLAQRGSPVDRVFILIAGRVRCQMSGQSWYDVGPGQSVGMTGFFSTGKHPASSYTMRTSELVHISTGAFEALCEAYPRIVRSYVHRAAARSIQLASRSRESKIFTIAVLPVRPAGTDDGFVDRFSHKLVGSLGDCCHVTQHTLPDAIRNMDHMLSSSAHHTPSEQFSHFGLARLTAWLSIQHESHQFVLLQAEGAADSWSRFCVQNADCVLLVAPASPSPAVSAHERELVWSGRRLVEPELVLIHDQVGCSPLPTNTAQALDCRPGLGQHHHLRARVDADHYRLARHLAGRQIGLVLGGGGSRGLAHLGALRAIELCAVPIDRIGGTSQGAFVSAAYAATLDPAATAARCAALADRFGSTWEAVQDMTLPFSSYLHGGRFSEAVWEALGVGPDCGIEDLWIPLFAVTTNVSQAQMQIERRGNLNRAVRASMSLAGVVPPVFMQGDLLVDGGYCNNLPGDIMRQEIGVSGKVIAVDVENKDNSAFDGASQLGGEKAGVSGWTILGLTLLSWLVRTGFKWPSYSQIQTSLAFMAHSKAIERMVERNHIDLLIRPAEIGDFGLVDYHKLRQIERMGLREATAQLQHFLHGLDTEQLASMQKSRDALPGSSADLADPSPPAEQC